MTDTFAPGMGTEGTYSPDNLIAGDFPLRSQGGTLLAGQSYVRGSVLGKVDASKKLTLCDPAADDGSENPVGILIADVDATSADAAGMMYISGDFNENALTIGGSGTADDIRDALRDLNIYLHKAVSA